MLGFVIFMFVVTVIGVMYLIHKLHKRDKTEVRVDTVTGTGVRRITVINDELLGEVYDDDGGELMECEDIIHIPDPIPVERESSLEDGLNGIGSPEIEPTEARVPIGNTEPEEVEQNETFTVETETFDGYDSDDGCDSGGGDD